jgi:RNA polymerase sigma-70 factor, ECF subfamily
MSGLARGGGGAVLDDETLYRQVMNGSESALVQLVKRYHSPLYKFLCRYTGDPHLADDLVQETFTRLITYRGEPPKHFKAWAYTIARNFARDHFKSARYRYERITDFEDESEVEITPDDFHFTCDDSREVMTALAKLSPEHREVLILRFYHELKLEEIAEVTRTPIGTVKSRLFHALKGLKRFLVLTEVVHD